MSSTSLLPDNATPLETALERTIIKMLGEIQSPFPALWRPDEAPITQLPWLAEALGVTEWDASASEIEKRETLKTHWANQRQAGMGVALARAIQPLGVGVLIRPWFEVGLDPYHFEIEINLSGKTLDPILLGRVEQRIVESKSERDTYSVSIIIESVPDGGAEDAAAYFGAAFTDIVVAESHPYPQVIESRPD